MKLKLDGLDLNLRENFRAIERELNESALLNGKFNFYEISFTKAETDRHVAHSLKFVPKDVIQTSVTGTGSITWNYDKFTDKHISITASGPCTVRAFIGTYGVKKT